MTRSSIQWLLVPVVVLVILAAGSGWLRGLNAEPPQTTPAIANAATVFDPIQSQLGDAGVPLRLPTYIPSRGEWQGASAPPVYATVLTVESGRYEVVLGYSRNCDGASACRLGAVSGEVQPTETPQAIYEATDYLYPGRRSTDSIASVTLAGQLNGTFLPWRCATNCTDAQVVWDEAGFRYSVGIKLGQRASVVQMANSAIEGGR
jgi:hypothetical protein